ncbi:hypothetical protein MMPV_009807 [Pyropia vietnamensis]
MAERVICSGDGLKNTVLPSLARRVATVSLLELRPPSCPSRYLPLCAEDGCLGPWQRLLASPLLVVVVVVVVVVVAAVAAAAVAIASVTAAADMAAASSATGGASLVPPVRIETFDAEALEAVILQLRSLRDALDAAFLGLCGILVFLMQTGFAMLTAGSVRSKNAQSLLFKNLIDCCTGAVAFYVFGYGFAFGDKGNGFLSYSQFALWNRDLDTSRNFFFQWTISAAASTIVSGAIAERATVYAYLLFSFLVTGFMYPVLAHAVWDSHGWLCTQNANPLLGSGMIDFAGSALVHVVGGLCGLWGALIVGPRSGRFVNGVVTPFLGHNVSLVVLGCLLLWTGWFGFNAGSGGALLGLVLSKLLIAHFDVCFIVNCLLGGLVSITAGAATMEPYAALLVGSIGALVYMGTSRALKHFHIDDPVDGTGVHLGCGLWGTLSVGLFSTERLQAIAGFNHTHYGLLYGGGGRLLLCQTIGTAVICGIVTVTIVPLFLVLRLFGILRVTIEQEEAGIDEFCHGGAAYPEDVRPWDSIAVEETEGSARAPSTLMLPGQGSFDPGAVESLMESAGRSPTGSTKSTGQLPRFKATCSRTTQPVGNGTSASFPDGRLLATVVDTERESSSLRTSQSAEPSWRGSAAERQHMRSMTNPTRRSSEGARSTVSVLPAVPDADLPW